MLEKYIKKPKRFLSIDSKLAALAIDDNLKKSYFIEFVKQNNDKSSSTNSLFFFSIFALPMSSSTKKDVYQLLSVVSDIKLISTQLIEQRLNALQKRYKKIAI